ncbi:hypothetical protein ACLB2K_039988 [Fragaria x ananassa]
MIRNGIRTAILTFSTRNEHRLSPKIVSLSQTHYTEWVTGVKNEDPPLLFRERKEKKKYKTLLGSSDYEYNVEVTPVTVQTSTEATACVEVLIASSLPIDPSHLNGTTGETPFTVNVPNSQSTITYESSASAKGMNITVPVSIMKQTIHARTMAAAKARGSHANKQAMTPRRKRQKAVQGEGLGTDH